MTPIPDWLTQEIDDYFAIPLNISPKTILDIGANIGAFALRAHQTWPQARIICYEPMPFNIQQLQNNTHSAWCQIIPAAVREQAGDADIYLGDLFVTSGFHKGPRQTDYRLRVSCVAAADIASCHLVKIDTEGCEVEILQHLNLSNTQALLLEHHSKADARCLKDLLHRAGFRLLAEQPNAQIGTLIFAR